MAREVDPKIEYEVVVFGLEAKTEMELGRNKCGERCEPVRKQK